jgi:cysteine synthase A
MIFGSVMELVGNTPLLKVSSFDDGKRADVYVKLEKYNPGGSIKDRTALGMIEAAEKEGKLKPGSIIIEPTSGNTGIALAMLGKAKGYRVVIVMPETMSLERRSLIKAYGAELVLTEGAKGMKGAIEKAMLLKSDLGEIAFVPQQFENAANPDIHYRTTGKEIFDDIPDLDAFVAGVGTGGTITGVASYLTERKGDVLIVAVEPVNSPVISGGQAGPHKIQGIGAGFVPDNYKGTNVSEVIKVRDEDAFQIAKEFSQKEGVLVGISSGANIFAALEVARKLGKGRKVVTVAPDGGEKYISMGLYD